MLSRKLMNGVSNMWMVSHPFDTLSSQTLSQSSSSPFGTELECKDFFFEVVAGLCQWYSSCVLSLTYVVITSFLLLGSFYTLFLLIVIHRAPFLPLVMNCFLTQFFTLQIENEIRILPPNLEPSFYFVTLWSREFISYN